LALAQANALGVSRQLAARARVSSRPTSRP